MSFGPPPSVFTQSAVTAQTEQKKRRRRTWLLVALLVALVAGLGTGGWLLWGRDAGSSSDGRSGEAAPGPLDVRQTVEKPPATTTGAMAFRFSVDDMSPGEHYALPGMWATDTILAKGINRTLAGYPIGADAAPGKKQEKWTVRLDGPICGYTQHVTVDHRTAVLFKASDREGAYCNHVVLVDLDDGTEVWERTFPVSTAGHSVSSPQRTPGVTLAHDTVAVTWGGGTSAFGLADGRSKWRTTVTGSCRDDGAAGGAGLLVRRACWKEGTPSSDIWDGTTYSVRKVDPATGATVWTYSAAKGVRDLVVPSAEPPVIGVSAGDTGLTELISLDAEGHNRATVSLQSGTYVGECSSSDYLVIDDCPTIAVGDGQVFLRSKDQTDQGTSNWIIGFDLATGTTTRKFDSGPHALLRPVRMSGHRLLALRTSEDGISPHALLSLDPATGGERPYLYFGLPVEAAPLTSIDDSDVLVQDGRVFFGAKTADGPGADQKKAWIYLVLGIGSAARE
ncbi:PQQ-binding-like beta-propeller repeat protein [Streptomyces longwoodensis]|uniref:outer membrane protein assembly factor BamB family protein n=1 Tax=Streptomyces longwoodensis TaxID=68231 RepID=UPI003247A747